MSISKTVKKKGTKRTKKRVIEYSFDVDPLKSSKNYVKSDYMRFSKKLIKPGAILPIYVDWKNQKKLQGYAKLNYKLSIPSEEYPYERASIGTGLNKEKDLVIFKFQRWNVTFVDPWDYNKNFTEQERWKYLNLKGFTTNKNISYFQSVDSLHIS